ncbi:MAG: CapA family protein [Ruminococcaceae bacterium]|nr:CapA family protein [Oscillospiraceae bacterium]
MKKERTSIVFTGDIGFDRYMDRRWEDENLLSQPILDFFHSADHVAANVEGALIDAEDNGSHGVFFHSMSPEVTGVLDKIHADIWCIGNNHTMDAGVEGLVSTRALAAERGCRTLGAGLNEVEASEPIYLDEAGGIGIFGVAYLAECIPATATEPGIFRWNDMDYIKRRIDEVKARCRWCVVVSHGGEEFSSLPNPYTRDRYLKYLELGADVVVAHHPHVPENYELFEDGKAIFYSLGNFIFDTNYQREHLYTDTGVLLKLIFTEDKLDFEAMGLRIVRGEERIVSAPLPDVFTNVPAEEYALLAPLSAKAFDMENRRTLAYLEPERFRNAPEEVWNAYYNSTEPDGYYEGEHMDFRVIVPFAKTAEAGAWKKSKLEKVRAYILRQLQ